MNKIFRSIGASLIAGLAQSLYKKVRPSAPELAKASRRTPSIWRLVFYALLGIGTIALTVSWLVVFGLPQIPQLPRFQFNWNTVGVIAIGLGFVLAFLWLAVKLRKEKAMATEPVNPWPPLSEVAPKPQATKSKKPVVPTAATTPAPAPAVARSEAEPVTPVITPELGDSTVPAKTKHLTVIAPTSEEEADEEVSAEAADETVSHTVAGPTPSSHEGDPQETGGNWVLSGLVKAAPWGIVAALLIALMLFQWKVSRTPEQTLKESEQAAQPQASDQPTASLCLTQAVLTTVTITREWSTPVRIPIKCQVTYDRKAVVAYQARDQNGRVRDYPRVLTEGRSTWEGKVNQLEFIVTDEEVEKLDIELLFEPIPAARTARK